jgi:hypothetical protein
MMLVMVPNSRQLKCQVGEHIVCDRYSVVAITINFIIRAGGVANEGDIRLTDEIIFAGCAFTLSQRLLALGSWTIYVTNHNSELHLFEETLLEHNDSPTSYPSLGLLGTDLDVWTQTNHVGAPPNVLHTGERPPLDHHRRGAFAAPPLLILLDLIWDPECRGDFCLILEHLMSREAPRGVVLSSMAGTDVSWLSTFLKIL